MKILRPDMVTGELIAQEEALQQQNQSSVAGEVFVNSGTVVEGVVEEVLEEGSILETVAEVVGDVVGGIVSGIAEILK